MNKKNVILVLAGVALVLLVTLSVLVGFLIAGGGKKSITDETKKEDTDGKDTSSTQIDYSLEPDIFEKDTATMPDWIANDPNVDEGPWNGDIYLSASDNGLDFTGEKFFMSHAGVPNLIKTSDGKLIATFQYFSFANEKLFDKIVYTISEDDGATWSKIRPIEFTGLSSEKDYSGGNPNPVDPTLVQLEDGTFRLYFTYQIKGDKDPSFHSAKAGSIDSVFTNEGKQLDVDEMVLDPAVVYFKGVWHHFTTYHDAALSSTTIRNLHSTSSTGLAFEQQEDITSSMNFLGDVIVDDGKLRFYGTGNGVRSAVSEDGFSWVMNEGTRVDGADPGVVKIDDESYVIIYTR